MLQAGKCAHPAQPHREAAHALGRLFERGHDIAELLLRLVAEEAQGDVEAGGSDPRDRLGERTEPRNLRGHVLAGLLAEETGHEGARHQRVSRRRSMSSAVCDDCHLMATRSPSKRHRRTSTPSGVAQPMYTVPTGFSALPPSGPAMPVTARPHAEPEMRHTPSAMARATGSLTAPWARRRCSGTPRSSSLARFEYTMTPRSM